VALIPEQMLLEHRHACHHAWFAACRERVQLKLRGDERGRELGVGGGSGSRAPDLGCDVVQLLAVLAGLLA
jgi:organic hydroperoxide reductase OsmC/OhrA